MSYNRSFNGYDYNFAWRMFKQGLLTGIQMKNGTIFVDEHQEPGKTTKPEKAPKRTAYIYACVQNQSQSNELHQQVTALLDVCTQADYTLGQVVQEYSSNKQNHDKFTELLDVLEHKKFFPKVLIMADNQIFSKLGLVILERYLAVLNTQLILVENNDSEKQ